jgi:hypothetical protein
LNFARLTLLLFLLGLVASRVGVVLHELAGHFGVARLFGCSLTELRLFLFGGGFVDYACPPLAPAQSLATELGGIGVQAGVGVALAILAWRRKRRDFAGLALASMAALFVLHGLWYLVTGVHYGVGDGRTLHLSLGPARVAPVAIGSALLVLLCFAATRSLARRLAPWLPDASPARRIGVLVASIALATALHAGAFAAEQRVLADATYAATFRPQAAVEVEREVARFAREAPRAPEQLAARRRALEAERAPFPLRAVLGGALAIAALAGVATALARGPVGRTASSRRALLVTAGVCAVVQAIVVALDRAF